MEKPNPSGLGFHSICHSERSEESYRRAVGNGPYKAETHVSPRRGGNLPPAVWTNSDPTAIVGSFVTSLLRMTGLLCHSERSEESCRRAVGNGPYKAGTHVSPRRGGNLPPAVWTITDPAAAEHDPGTLCSNAPARPQR